MKTSRNVVLPLVGLLALLIYILACTSFSPDDKKILFPTFDQSGAIAMAVYDRDTRRTEPLYASMTIETGTNQPVPALMRGAWMTDGKYILVASTSEASKDALEFTVLPSDGRGGVRSYRIAGMEDPGLSFITPPCLSGFQVLFKAGSGSIARLDLRTGAVKSAEVDAGNKDLNLYPSPDAQGAFFVWQTNSGVLFGRVDPERLTLTPLMTITNSLQDGAFFAYNAGGTHVAFVDKGENGASRCVLMEKGTVRFTRKLDSGDRKMTFGNAILSPRADKLWVAFTREAPNTNRIACGLIEIPLSQAPVREKVLIPDMSSAGSGSEWYWQVGISHDGKTAAICSTYLACADDEFKPENCALFIVDLGSSEWKVTKVPIPLPAARGNPVGK